MDASKLMFREGLMAGERILVTGGGTGLGREMAEAFLKLGATVYICGRRQNKLDETAAELTALHGGKWLEAVTLRTGSAERRIDTRALFIMIGAAPNTDWLSGLAETDAKGFVLTGAAAGQGDDYATTAPGIFAVGDVRAGSVKRVASAVGEGSVVVSRIWQYLEDTRPG